MKGDQNYLLRVLRAFLAFSACSRLSNDKTIPTEIPGRSLLPNGAINCPRATCEPFSSVMTTGPWTCNRMISLISGTVLSANLKAKYTFVSPSPTRIELVITS